MSGPPFDTCLTSDYFTATFPCSSEITYTSGQTLFLKFVKQKTKFIQGNFLSLLKVRTDTEKCKKKKLRLQVEDHIPKICN